MIFRGVAEKPLIEMGQKLSGMIKHTSHNTFVKTKFHFDQCKLLKYQHSGPMKYFQCTRDETSLKSASRFLRYASLRKSTSEV